MTKITSDMRRMVNDPEFFAVVKALCEAQDMMRNYERKHLSQRRQRYHDEARAAAVAYRGMPVERSEAASPIEGASELPPSWGRKVSPKPTKPTLHD